MAVPRDLSSNFLTLLGLQDISNDLWIIGVIAAAALVLSTVMSVIYFLFSLCGGAGAHIRVGQLGQPYGQARLRRGGLGGQGGEGAACEHDRR